MTNRQSRPAVEAYAQELSFKHMARNLINDLADLMGDDEYLAWVEPYDFRVLTWYQIYWLIKNKIEEVKNEG